MLREEEVMRQHAAALVMQACYRERLAHHNWLPGGGRGERSSLEASAQRLDQVIGHATHAQKARTAKDRRTAAASKKVGDGWWVWRWLGCGGPQATNPAGERAVTPGKQVSLRL